MFYAAFLPHLCNTLFYIFYTKFPICFALRFLANLCNNLSYIFYRKFPTHFASVFLDILNHIFVLYISIIVEISISKGVLYVGLYI